MSTQDLGNGYILRSKLDKLALIAWSNVQCDKFANWTLNTESGEWSQTDGTHTKKLPGYIVNMVGA